MVVAIGKLTSVKMQTVLRGFVVYMDSGQKWVGIFGARYMKRAKDCGVAILPHSVTA